MLRHVYIYIYIYRRILKVFTNGHIATCILLYSSVGTCRYDTMFNLERVATTFHC